MGKTYENINIVGGGLAGCEASYQLLKRGFSVTMYEMRPHLTTGAHKTQNLGELVCSNSFKSMDPSTSSGLLKAELGVLDSMLLRLANEARVEAGGALAVDRVKFSKAIERELFKFEKFSLVREEVKDVSFESPTIIATGPLTSNALAQKLAELSGDSNLFFFDAVAPILSASSVDMNFAFWGGRYGKGGNDYLNLPMSKEEYLSFYNELVKADCVELKDFEGTEVFEGCMPIEVMAKRGEDAMRFGPLKPVGLYDPKTNKRGYAVVQLRKENVAGDALNLVGFQTNLTFSEQKRVFQMIPALHDCEFLRYGVMHRNTYLNSPKLLDASFKVKSDCLRNKNICTNDVSANDKTTQEKSGNVCNKKNTQNLLYVAGQLSGVEGYVESIMSGLLAGIALSRELVGKSRILPPRDTICGELSRWIETENVNFQPMNANFGLLSTLEIRNKKDRKAEYSNRALKAIIEFSKQLEK